MKRMRVKLQKNDATQFSPGIFAIVISLSLLLTSKDVSLRIGDRAIEQAA